MAEHAANALLPVADAAARLNDDARGLQQREQVTLLQSDGRATADDIYATMAVPPWDNSAMDGYALRHADIQAGQAYTVSQRIAAGRAPEALQAGTVARIFTGAPLPPGADTVIMQENAQVDSATGQVQFTQLAQQGENVRKRGADLAAGALLFKRGHRLRPVDLGLLAATGVQQVSVGRLPTVAVLTTGDELQLPGQPLGPAQIYDSNSTVLQAMLRRIGIIPSRVLTLPDDYDATCSTLAELATQVDVIISTGGVSAGEEDHVRSALQALGDLKIWKLALKPGKPFAFGRLGRARFYGLPGNPVSSFVTFLLLVRPALLTAAGVSNNQPPFRWVRAAHALEPTTQRQTYVRVTIDYGAIDNRAVDNGPGGPQATALQEQSSGVLSSLSRADGLLEVPPHTQVQQGDQLRFFAFDDIV